MHRHTDRVALLLAEVSPTAADDKKAGRRIWSAISVSLCLLLVGTQVALASSDPEVLASTSDALYQLLRQKDYIELDRALASNPNLGPVDHAFFTGVMANRKNQVAESIKSLEPLLSVFASQYSTPAAIALCTLADDYSKSFRYADAADTYRLLAHLPGYKQDSSGCHADVEAGRWDLLRYAPEQTTSVTVPFFIKATPDALGLLKVQVTASNISDQWLVDTGANLSAITRSVAAQLGLELSATTATAQGSAGITVPVHTAVIPELQLGGATVRNVAVLVFEDKDLEFPQIPYQVHGSIGFPVLEALGAITFHSDGTIGVQEPVRRRQANIYLERLTPLLQVTVAGQEALLTLDTGANGTFLSAQYYRDHRPTLVAADESQLEITGAGGLQSIPVIMLRNVQIELGSVCTFFSTLPVLTQTTGQDDEFSGNIGQSAVRGLQSYTLDFGAMTFTAEGNPVGSGSQDTCIIIN